MLPSWILIFKLIKIQKWYQKWVLYATFSRKSDITQVSMTICFNCLEFWWLDWSKYQNDARNGFSMPKLVGRMYYKAFDMILFWSYISNMAIGSHFGFWLLTNSAAIFARVMGAILFSRYFKELKSSVKPYYALSGHGTPRSHLTTWC